MPAPASTASAAAPPIAAPPFDGNVAGIAWGGRVESITGEAPGTGRQNTLILITKEFNSFTTANLAPIDIVISFFRREPVLVSSVTLVSLAGVMGIKDFEIWTSTTGPDAGFTKAANGSIERDDHVNALPESTARFSPVEARFVKIRLVRAHEAGRSFRLQRIRIFEAQAPGYVPLLTRHPEIAAPTFVAEGLAAAASQPAPGSEGCVPAQEPPMRAGNGESKNVLVLVHWYLDEPAWYIPDAVKAKRVSAQYVASRPEFGIFDRVETTVIQSNR
jgi:hypothetical protein